MDSLDIKTRLGRVIRRHREAQAFSQEGFADHIGLHRTYVGQLERGRLNVTILTLQRVAKGLSLRPSRLLEQAEEYEDDGAERLSSNAPRRGRPSGSRRSHAESKDR